MENSLKKTGWQSPRTQNMMIMPSCMIERGRGRKLMGAVWVEAQSKATSLRLICSLSSCYQLYFFPSAVGSSVLSPWENSLGDEAYGRWQEESLWQQIRTEEKEMWDDWHSARLKGVLQIRQRVLDMKSYRRLSYQNNNDNNTHITRGMIEFKKVLSPFRVGRYKLLVFLFSMKLGDFWINSGIIW